MKYQRITNALRFNRFLWASCILILLFNLGYYAIHVQRQKDEIKKLQIIYSQKRNPGQGYPGQEFASYMVAQLDLNIFRAKLPPKEKFVVLVKELNELLHRHGLDAGRMAFRPEEVASLKLWKYTSTFGVSGTYTQLKGFIADLQNSPSLFSLDNLSFLNRSNDGERVDMTLQISTYFR
jgi:Tfp pilus assembly protein PilO